jgi:HAE1 family hydrophobic/amphiphilic exporter-1
LLGTPIAVFGAFFALMVGRYENNIYAQIALVMLIGLAAKNAILIVEFAKSGVEQGKPLVEAALEAARLRLRPILMTSLASILGFLPLCLATGAGALARQAMGFAVLGGLIAASFIAVFLIPVSFTLVERLRQRSAGPPAKNG